MYTTFYYVIKVSHLFVIHLCSTIVMARRFGGSILLNLSTSYYDDTQSLYGRVLGLRLVVTSRSRNFFIDGGLMEFIWWVLH